MSESKLENKNLPLVKCTKHGKKYGQGTEVFCNLPCTKRDDNVTDNEKCVCGCSETEIHFDDCNQLRVCANCGKIRYKFQF
jgi:hypothetical protein